MPVEEQVVSIYAGTNGYLLQMVRSELENKAKISPEQIDTGGFKIVTTIDRKAQRSAAEAVEESTPVEPGAGPFDAAQVTERMIRLAEHGTLTAVDGSTVHLAAESICVHGDTPGSAAMAAEVRAGLERAGITIRSFV